MERYVIATIKSWNLENGERLMRRYPEQEIVLVRSKEELSPALLNEIQPRFVFFPHWSWIIPESVYSKYHCVVFHMTDLPFGRGGSPLQNLLARGIYNTKVSAIRVGAGMDTGPVYFKEPLDLSEGNADAMLRRASDIVFEKMIPRFFHEEPIPHEQVGETVVFKRRTAEQSRIPDGITQRQLYDHIRMLDGEGYPTAYQKTSTGKVYYRNARLADGVVYADAEFRREQ